MIEEKRKNRESAESLIRRFSRRVRQSGVLMQARKSRFRTKDKTKREMISGALYKEKVRRVVNKLKKMGKFEEENFRNVKKKLIK